MTYVSKLAIDSSYGQATIGISRTYTGRYRPEPSDLPEDMRKALLAWLGVKPGNYCRGCGRDVRSFCADCAEVQ